MELLFEKFLSEKKIYNLNEAYYNRLFRKITGEKPVPYYNDGWRTG